VGLKVHTVHLYGIESTWGASHWDWKYIRYIFMGL